MNINDVPAYSGNTLKAQDLGSNEFPLTINSYQIQDVGGKGESKDTKAVLSFKEAKKGFVLNKTNANTIASMYGPEMDHWIGKKITLFATQTDFAGKPVPCIRVKLPQSPAASVAFPPSGPQPLPEDAMMDTRPEQDIPF
ncbi:hypothetical protein LCGC14_1464250 [marine sediment metagenome]|uniref:Uncharacterized protein n=1 Tax=marine sediment metagenome TaxID=412755 RepID=A0A0F9K070_9ZZZZ